MIFSFIDSEEKKRNARRFLLKHESMCVSLGELLLRGDASIVALENNAHNTLALFRLSRTILHCIPEGGFQKHAQFLENEIAKFLDEKKYFEKNENRCINGEAFGSKIFMNVFARAKQNVLQHNRYTLMTFPQSRFEKIARIPFETIREDAKKLLNENWRIEKCRMSDIDSLMPLELAYQSEEVVPACRTISGAAVRKHLEHLIRNEYVLALVNDKNEFVSKANTNAIAHRYAQIGGVYTMAGYRNNHFASLLLELLLAKIIASGRRPVLYVKNENEIAKKLYRTLGFKPSRDFTIAYY